jgi:hypothetical protein
VDIKSQSAYDHEDEGEAVNKNTINGSVLQSQEELEELLIEYEAWQQRDQKSLNQPTGNLIVRMNSLENAAEPNNVDTDENGVHHEQ